MDRQTVKTRKMRVIDSKKVITFPKEQERQQEEAEVQAINGYFEQRAKQLDGHSKADLIRDYIWLEWHLMTIAEGFLAENEELDSDIYSAIYGIIDDKAYSLLAETDKAGRFKTLLEAIRED